MINKKILSLALPNIVTNITVPILGMVDLAIAGRLGDEKYIGAAALGTAIFNLVYWNFAFLRMGTSGFTAQAYGARDFKESVSVLMRGLGVAVVMGVLLILFQSSLADISLSLLNASNDTGELARQYFFVRIWAAPFTLSMYVLTGWFIGMQNAKTPMWVAMIMNAVNVLFSLLFVYEFDMGIRGIALGTLISQVSGVACSVFVLIVYYRKILFYAVMREVFNLKALSRFFKLNTDIFFRTLCLVLVYTFFTSASSSVNDMTLAVNSLLMQLFALFSYFMDGFAFAAEALVGRYYGAGNKYMLAKSAKWLLVWGGVVAVIMMLCYMFWFESIISIFTSSQTVIAETVKSKMWIMLIPLAGFVPFMYDGMLIGVTRSSIMRNTVFVATIVFFAIFYAAKSTLGVTDALWLSFIIYLFSRGIIQAFAARKILF